MNRVRSGDTEIAYEIVGTGAPVVLLHPFPTNHQFWLPVAETLSTRYQLILPDLRGHGDSGIGEGPATMEKHALDIAQVLDDADVGRAPIIVCSIGGYVFFEFWRRFRGRVAAVVLSNTKASADTPQARVERLKNAEGVLERGTEPFFETMSQKLMGQTTLTTRPDLVEGARKMMRRMSAQNVSQVLTGMAERPDSTETLKSINVPALVITGEEDVMTPLADAELMRQGIPVSQLKVIARAGHYAPWEQPEELGRILRQFLDGLS